MSRLANSSINTKPGCGKIPALVLMAFVLLQLPVGAQTVITTNTASALRQALQGGGTVVLNFDNTVTLTNPITINSSVELDASGHSVTITGNGLNQLFIVPTPDVTFTIKNVTLAGGKAAGANGGNGGNGSNGTSTGQSGGPGAVGAPGKGGAIMNQGVLNLINCNLITNSAVGGNGGTGGNGGNGDFQGGNGGNGGNGGAGQGGAIYNSTGASLVLSNCNFVSNTVLGGNGGSGGTNGTGGVTSLMGNGGTGANGSGAAVYNLGDLTVINCAFSENLGTGGNTATAGSGSSGSNGLNGQKGGDSFGGAINNLAFAGVTNCTFFRNRVRGGNGGNGGPGSFQGGNGGNGGNGFGGGVYNSNAGEIFIASCTFSNGLAFGGTNGLAGTGPFIGNAGSMGQASGGSIANGGGIFNIVNSILARPAGSVANANGAFSDFGSNISSDNTPAWNGGSRNNLNPKLEAFTDNGGPTPTMGLTLGSPAIDSGNDDFVLPFDQRGRPRPAGVQTDIGAFEFGNNGFAISGRVFVGTNAAAGVTVTTGEDSVVTDASGSFVFINLPPGTNVVTPQPSSLFVPTSSTVVVGPSQSSINFTSTLGTTRIIVVSNSQSSFLVTGLPNRDYNILTSTNLTNWTVLRTTNSGSSGLLDITQPVAGFPTRFFRAVIP